MNNYYFTFGIGHELAKYFQPIIADSIDKATKVMLAQHGTEWSNGYTQEDFHEALSNGVFTDLEALEWLQQTITVGEVATLGERLNQIISASQLHKTNRLERLRADIEMAFDLEADPIANQIHKDVQLEIDLSEMRYFIA